jgi:hypothetical protein
MLLESSGVPDEPVAPHIRLEELFEFPTLPDVLCAWAVVERITSPIVAKVAPIGLSNRIARAP